MNRHLILMRHAKSDWNQHGLRDKDRPLNARGRAAAPRMAHWLREWLSSNRCGIDRILSSSSVRTRETLDRMLEEWQLTSDSSIEWLDELYLAEPRVIWEAIRDAFQSHPEDRCLMVLGHNPGMEILISALAAVDLDVPTATIAIFASDEVGDLGELVPAIERGVWKRVAFQTPRLLSP